MVFNNSVCTWDRFLAPCPLYGWAVQRDREYIPSTSAFRKRKKRTLTSQLEEEGKKRLAIYFREEDMLTPMDIQFLSATGIFRMFALFLRHHSVCSATVSF